MRPFPVSVVLRLIAAGLLFWALGRHRYGYFQVLRLLVCGAGLYSAAVAWRYARQNWAWFFVAVAVLFNPFVLVHLERGTWRAVDPAVGAALIVSCWFMREVPTANRRRS